MSSTHRRKTPPHSRYYDLFQEEVPLCPVCISSGEQNSILECCQGNTHPPSDHNCPECWGNKELNTLTEKGKCPACELFFPICFSCSSRLDDKPMGEYRTVSCQECSDRGVFGDSADGFADIRYDVSVGDFVEPIIDQDRFVQKMRNFFTRMSPIPRAELIQRLIQDLVLHREKIYREITGQ